MVARKKTKTKYIFPVIYLVPVLGAATLGLLSNSFFAYDIVNHLWANILYLLCISALYITAYVQELLAKRSPCDIVIHSFIFLGSLLFFFLFYFLNIYFTLAAIVYSAIMMCFIAVRSVLTMRSTRHIPDDSDIDVKPPIAILAIILFAMAGMMSSINYVSEIFMAWALIPAAIITVILGGIAVFLLRDLFYSKLIRIGKSLLVALIVFFIIYVYCNTTIGIANFAFDHSDPTPIVCTVLDKNISSGARTPTTHELKVKINNEDMWVDVSTTEYFAISEGDEITVQYYSGAFGFAYVIYNEKTE